MLLKTKILTSAKDCGNSTPGDEPIPNHCID